MSSEHRQIDTGEFEAQSTVADEWPVVSMETLAQSGYEDFLRVAWGVELGKCAPIGYETAAQFMRDGRSTYHVPVHDVWFLAEAKAADQELEAREEFPNSSRMAAHFFDAMRKQPVQDNIIKHIRQEVEWLPDYKKPPNGIIKTLVGKVAFRALQWSDS